MLKRFNRLSRLWVWGCESVSAVESITFALLPRTNLDADSFGYAEHEPLMKVLPGAVLFEVRIHSRKR